MGLVFLLGLAAALIQVAAYFLYLWQVVRKETSPNGMSWAMWTYGTFVFFFIEYQAGAPVSILLLPAACILCSAMIAAYAFFKQAYIAPSLKDYVALSVDVVLLVSYLMLFFGTSFGYFNFDEKAVNSIFVFLASLSVIVTFYPIIRTTHSEPSNESSYAWWMWTLAYALLALTVVLQEIDIVYLLSPLVSLLLHGAVGMLSLQSRRRPRTLATASPVA